MRLDQPLSNHEDQDMKTNIIKLQGKTLKGRNVIRNHGKDWKIRKHQAHLMCFDGPGVLVGPADESEFSYAHRWVETREDSWVPNDKDFELVPGAVCPDFLHDSVHIDPQAPKLASPESI